MSQKVGILKLDVGHKVITEELQWPKHLWNHTDIIKTRVV